MDRMKTFLKYFIAFVLVYVLVNVGTYFILKSTYISRDYEINIDSPKVEIVEAKTTVENGYVKGKITNNTENIVTGSALKLEYYTKRGVLAGTKYVKIDNLLQGEEKEFESRFNFDNVDSIKISLVDSLESQNTEGWDFSLDDWAKDPVNLFVVLSTLIVVFC